MSRKILHAFLAHCQFAFRVTVSLYLIALLETHVAGEFRRRRGVLVAVCAHYFVYFGKSAPLAVLKSASLAF